MHTDESQAVSSNSSGPMERKRVGRFQRAWRTSIAPLCFLVAGSLGPVSLAKTRPAVRAELQHAASVEARPLPAAPSGSPAGGATKTAPGQAAAATTPTLPATFEELLAGAQPLGDLATLLISAPGRCEAFPRSIDRARCEGSRAFLRRTLPQKTFQTLATDPQVLSVSAYDPAVTGYHVSVAGCLACAKPVAADNEGDLRFVTLKAPEVGETLREQVEWNRSTAGFESEAEATDWWEQAEGNLRVQFIFRPALTEWAQPNRRGYALQGLGFRVYNACTREVLVSRPPSTRNVDIELAESCPEKATGRSTKTDKTANTVADSLTSNDIASAMAGIRPQVFACFQTFKVPGRAEFDYTISSNGTVQAARLNGVFAGTPTGKCLLEAARNARFPHFRTSRQQFSYPFFLRDE